MSNVVFVNITAWMTDQVVDWLKGLDDVLHPYIPNFVNAGVTGKRLLCFTHHDLQKLQINKLGHQELILEAVRLLTALHYELESENVQSLALRLSCKANCLKGEVAKAGIEPLQVVNGNVMDHRPMHRIPLLVLTATADLITTLKQLVSWLERPPFDNSDGYIKTRNNLVSLGMNLIAAAQNESLLHTQELVIRNCEDLINIAETLITGSSDPLTIQPSCLELTTIRKKPEDELGMRIQSSYNGVHVIRVVEDQSPADLCGKIEEGDEVIQVNYQTVVGWQLKRLVSVIKENPKEVTLTLKKRPRHANPYGLHGNKRKINNKLKQATFPKSLRKSRDMTQLGGRSPLTEFLSAIPPPSEPFSESLPALPGLSNLIDSIVDSTVSVPDLTTAGRDSIGLDSASIQRLSLLGKSSSVPDLTSAVFGKPPSCRHDTDNDCDVFASHSESMDYQLDAKHRRATVSGGSPTLKRPAIRISEFTSGSRTKPHHTITVSSPSSEEGNGIGSPTSDDRWSPPTTPGLRYDPTAQINKLTDHPRTMSSQTSDSSTCDEMFSLDGSFITSPVTTPGSGAVSPEWRPSPDRHFRSSESPKRRQASRMASKEIAGDQKGGPQLVRVVRLDSQRRPITPDREVRYDGSSRENSPGPGRDSPDGMTSYTVSIVGGVAQKMPSKARDASPGSPNSLLRKKTLMKRVEADLHNLVGQRRISCRDLGNGECQGWLWKRRESPGVFVSKWVKRWFVLKNCNLYFYKDPEDLRAKGVLYMPGFQISPAPEIKSKKLAFKAHHSGTTFYFAAERQEDMGKWMSKMGLAAIEFKTSASSNPAGSPRLDHRDQNAYYSESDDEDGQKSSAHNTPNISPGGSKEDLTSDHFQRMETNIRRAHLTLDGADKRKKRASALTATELLEVEQIQSVAVTRRLLSLERTLKDKESELDTLYDLLKKEKVTSSDLNQFRQKHPNIVDKLNDSIVSDSTSTLSPPSSAAEKDAKDPNESNHQTKSIQEEFIYDDDVFEEDHSGNNEYLIYYDEEENSYDNDYRETMNCSDGEELDLLDFEDLEEDAVLVPQSLTLSMTSTLAASEASNSSSSSSVVMVTESSPVTMSFLTPLFRVMKNLLDWHQESCLCPPDKDEATSA